MMINEHEIMTAVSPSDIFTMNVDTIEEEKERLLSCFKPKAYSNIKNFLVSQKIILLYREALEQLSEQDNDANFYMLNISKQDGNTLTYNYHYKYNSKLCETYITETEVIYIFPKTHKKYYYNYIDKVKCLTKVDHNIWEHIQYMVPKITDYFEDTDGSYVIIVAKPCKIYPLREILNFFNNKLAPEYVASILTRLYYFLCYLDIIGVNHNGIITDNLFFAPGRKLKEGERYTVEDIRIVGVFGGWSFATTSDEPLSACPKIIYDLFEQKPKYSSFEVDALAIKQVARELLGDITGKNLQNVPKPFIRFVNDEHIASTSYDEFAKWEKTIIDSFGKKRFVDMDVSI